MSQLRLVETRFAKLAGNLMRQSISSNARKRPQGFVGCIRRIESSGAPKSKQTKFYTPSYKWATMHVAVVEGSGLVTITRRSSSRAPKSRHRAVFAFSLNRKSRHGRNRTRVLNLAQMPNAAATEPPRRPAGLQAQAGCKEMQTTRLPCNSYKLF